MKVKDLKALLEKVDDDIEIVVDGDEGVYYTIGFVDTRKAIYNKKLKLLFQVDEEGLKDHEEITQVLWMK